LGVIPPFRATTSHPADSTDRADWRKPLAVLPPTPPTPWGSFAGSSWSREILARASATPQRQRSGAGGHRAPSRRRPHPVLSQKRGHVKRAADLLPRADAPRARASQHVV